VTIADIFIFILNYKIPLMVILYAAPWVAWGLCMVIPGRREEAFLLSTNMAGALVCLILWVGYVAYALNTGGWVKIVHQADLLLLAAPPYYMLASIWLSRSRLPLESIPAYRTLQGLAMLAGVFLVLSWILNRIRIVFFSFFPLHLFFILVAGLLLIGYTGYRRLHR